VSEIDSHSECIANEDDCQDKGCGSETKRCPVAPSFLDCLAILRGNESGATAVEYGLIAAGITLAAISLIKGLGTNLKSLFSSVPTSVE